MQRREAMCRGLTSDECIICDTGWRRHQRVSILEIVVSFHDIRYLSIYKDNSSCVIHCTVDYLEHYGAIFCACLPSYLNDLQNTSLVIVAATIWITRFQLVVNHLI
jgi:hypothetical protein